MRDTVVAYVSDGVKQDELVKLSAAIPADLPVGSVVDTTGTLITTAADADYVVVEFAKAGSTAIVVANPYHTILKKSGLITNGVDLSSVVEQLQALHHSFADFATVALRTT
ncbi:TPA: hypothetical protein L7V36_005046 [Klebsiella pneumoniae]|nr:hypothetical protein DQB71_02950 [Klebsiella pneumoniae subsp. pneumoniae]EJE5322773.1 hypothetical protein [Escherichia coli]MBC4641506.1 hypothetical protein [Klebsiella quasipneumoniae]MCI8002371.1 hypothetical protein [Klebsiella pneumoniae]MBC4693432.1 hypothetical protein [Klebsiella quasipneumoniae]